MPGMPVYQDFPSQLKGQIYVVDQTNQKVVPLQVDAAGNLNVAGTVGLAKGAVVGLAANSEVGLVAGTVVDLADGAIVGLAANSEVALANGTTIGLDAGTNVVGKFEHELVFNSFDAFDAATPMTEKAIGVGEAVTATQRDISKESSYMWFIKNTGTAAEQSITLTVQISPDGINWVDDTGVAISVANGESKIIAVNHFLKYVRYTITGGAAATTVISCFQSQH